MQNRASLFVPHTTWCMCGRDVVSLSFIDEAKEMKSQDLGSVKGQEQRGTHKCLSDDSRLKCG